MNFCRNEPSAVACAFNFSHFNNILDTYYVMQDDVKQQTNICAAIVLARGKLIYFVFFIYSFRKL